MDFYLRFSLICATIGASKKSPLAGGLIASRESHLQTLDSVYLGIGHKDNPSPRAWGFLFVPPVGLSAGQNGQTMGQNLNNLPAAFRAAQHKKEAGSTCPL
jgi:hypothetical protein